MIKHIHLVYLTMIVTWLPWNAVTYFWGFPLLAFTILGTSKVTLTRIQSNLLALGLAILAIFSISLIVNIWVLGSSLNNTFWFVVSNGSFLSYAIALLLMKFKDGDLEKILRFLIIISFIQIGIGYAQMVSVYSSFNPFAVSLAAGDQFVGTMGNTGLAHLVAAKMSIVALFFVPIWLSKRTWKNTAILIALVIGWLLPSALYSVIIGFSALAIYYFYKYFLLKLLRGYLSLSIVGIALMIVVGIGFVFLTQSSNVSYVKVMLTRFIKTIDGSEEDHYALQKIEFYKSSIVDVPKEYPHSLLVGIGPGNYSSRAAWIVSGLYLAHQPNYIPTTPSTVASEFAVPYFLNILFERRDSAGSVAHQPFSSWISIFCELGLLAVFLAIMVFVVVYRKTSSLNSRQSDSIRILLIYLFLFMFVDNILEYPHFMNQLISLVIPAFHIKTQG